MNIVRLHELIDQWYQEELKKPELTTESAEITHEPKRELPEGKRAVRTKSQGDKVFYLDEEKKTRQWATNEEVLKSLGFELNDVVEVNDVDLYSYQQGAPIYKPVENAAT